MSTKSTGSRLRVGVIGTGNWARAAHLPAFTSHPRTELVAIAGIDRAEAELAARTFEVDQIFDSAAALIAGAKPDMISIVTPDDAHVEPAQLAIAAGIPLLCEKPLAVTISEASQLSELAAAARVPTKMGFSLRYAPAVRWLKDLVTNQELGDLRLLQAFQQNGQFLDPMKPFHWKMDASRTGGGAIVEYGIHTLDLARWLMGDASRVSATGSTAVSERPLLEGGNRQITVDDSTAWLTEFQSGALGLAHAGWSTTGRAPGIELRVFGSNGAAKVVLSNELPGEEAAWRASAEDQAFEPVTIPNRYSEGTQRDWPWWRRYTYAMIDDFIAELDGASTPSATFADGLAAQKLLSAVIEATNERKWVSLS